MLMNFIKVLTLSIHRKSIVKMYVQYFLIDIRTVHNLEY